MNSRFSGRSGHSRSKFDSIYFKSVPNTCIELSCHKIANADKSSKSQDQNSTAGIRYAQCWLIAHCSPDCPIYLHSTSIISRDCSLSYNEVEKLAESLSDGTVFGIISELKEIQHIKLSNLSSERSSIVKSFQVSLVNLVVLLFKSCRVFWASCDFLLVGLLHSRRWLKCNLSGL